jgi:hypothetical protein
MQGAKVVPALTEAVVLLCCEHSTVPSLGALSPGLKVIAILSPQLVGCEKETMGSDRRLTF